MTPNAPPLAGERPARASHLARAVKSQWFAGQTADTRAALDEYPELAEDRNAVLDLAYEEYWQRKLEGEEVGREEYLARFPGYESSLRRLLFADEYLGDHPSLVDEYRPANAGWPAEGETVGDLTVIRELGRGSFARVYLATEASAGDRPVAVKLSRAVTNEAHTQGPLDHDHIMPVLWADRHTESGWYIVCMPFLGCATAHDLIDGLHHGATLRVPGHPPRRARAILEVIRAASPSADPPPVRQQAGPGLEHVSFVEGVRRLAVGLADALACLHARQWFHCDLKPSNILLTPGGRPLLLDFNLAQAACAPPERVGGTFPYMAPEQIRAWLAGTRLPSEQAGPADLFGLAVVLYELLTGRHPFGFPKGKTPEELGKAALDLQAAGFAPIRLLNPDVPQRLAGLLERCLSADPARRPAGAAELTAELRRCEPPRRLPLVGSAAAALVLALTAFLGPGLSPTLKQVAPPTVEPHQVETQRQRGHERLARGRELASRDPERARRLLRQADEAFGKVIDARRKAGQLGGLWRDYLARGRARLLMNEASDAQTAFREADEAYRDEHASRNPGILACRAWCLAQTGNHPAALLLGKQALDAGLRTPGLLNNLAYSHIQQKKEFVQARRYLTEALRRQPELQAALRNRAALDLHEYQQALRSKSEHTLPACALDDINKAIWLSRRAGGPESSDLCLLAARLYACAVIDARRELEHHDDMAGDLTERSRLAERLRSLKREADQHLKRACILGADAAPLGRDPLLTTALKEELDPVRLARLPRQPGAPNAPTDLIDPLPASMD